MQIGGFYYKKEFLLQQVCVTQFDMLKRQKVHKKIQNR